MALASLATPQAALDARYTVPTGTVYIGGWSTPYLSFSVQFRAGQTATGRITLPLPRPSWVTANAEVVIEGGHNDLVGTYFAGTVLRWTNRMTAQGDTIEIQLAGPSRRLVRPYREDATYRGPVDAGYLFSDLCQRSGVPSFIAHAALFPDGSPLTLGGNPNVDDGTITIDANTSPLAQFRRLVEPYAYHVTDTPSGAVLFHRILGIPSEPPKVAFYEGLHLGDTTRTYDPSDILNVPDVHGATYTDVWGGQVPIRSIADPATVDPHPEIIGGYGYEVISNSDLVRPDQADAVRNVIEINQSEADAPVSWEAVAVPFIAPGDVITVESETVEATGRYWLLALDISEPERGPVTASYDAWAGAGEEKPGIEDRTTQPIEVGPVHLGDEFVNHYAQKSPVGTEKAWPFTLPAKVTTANARGWSHSWNSQTVAGKDTELTVSRWAIWEAGVDRTNDDNRPISSGTMPTQAERYYEGLDFAEFRVDASKPIGHPDRVTNPGEWVPFAVNLRQLDPGDYVLVFTCGEDKGFDDGELREVYLELYGLVEAAGGGA